MTGLGSFAGAEDDPDGVAHDVDLGTAGTQLLVAPALDGNGNTTPDVEDVANELVASGGTCYSCGLEAAIDILTGREHERGQRRHLPLRRLQRRRRERLDGDRLPGGDHPQLRARRSGSGELLGTGRGNLDAVAALTPGGTCQQTEDFADVGDVISEAIRSTLSAVTFTVDAVPRPIVVVPALPLPGRPAVAFSTTLLELSA